MSGGSRSTGAPGPLRRPGSPWASPWVLVPTVVGLVVAVVLLVAGNPQGLRFTVPLATVVGIAGVALGSVALAVLMLRRALSRARAAGAAQAREVERVAHRRFLDRLDHELKNPLTAIHAAAASVSATTTDDDRHSPVAVIDAQAARMGRLVGDLRKIAALDSQPIEQEAVDVEALAEDVVSAVQEELAVQGTVGRDITVALPRVPWPLPPVRGDVDLLFVALYNVLSNAVKFSPEGARIELRGFEEEGAVVLEVADSGAGIPPDEVSFVWDELARGSNTRGVQGSGLGLAMVHAVVRRHGGQVQLSSRLGHGTSVRLRLPAIFRI